MKLKLQSNVLKVAFVFAMVFALGTSVVTVKAADTVGPSITVKEDAAYTTGDVQSNTYKSVSFKLYDYDKVDYVVVNGQKKELTNNKYSDVNFVSIGKNGGINGKNTLVAYDVAGNATTYTFYLRNKGPEIFIKDGEDYTIGDKETAKFSKVSFKLRGESKVDFIIINGNRVELTNAKFSDWNFVAVGKSYGVQGENIIVVYDVVGNSTTYKFILDNKGPQIEVKDGEEYTIGDKEKAEFSKVSFKLRDESKIDFVVINGNKVELTNDKFSDWNYVAVSKNYGVKGENKIVAYDAAGNSTVYTFYL